MGKLDSVKIRPREEELHRKWQSKADRVPVNNQQYSFDSIERQEAFISAMFPSEEERARYREYRAEWYRRAKEFDPGESPLAVCCELVSTCSLKCPMCYTMTEEFQSSVVGDQRMLPWEIVKAVIDECADLGVPSMLFSWRGESTIYRSKDEKGKVVDFADVLAYARSKGILEITSLTNGQMIDSEMAKRIVDAEPSWISFSVDGLEDAYNRIRTPANRKVADYNAFHAVMRNIKAMIGRRNQLDRTRPQLRTNTIFPPIANDPQRYYEVMRNSGIGWVTVNEIMDFRGKELPEAAIIKDWACQYPFQRITISANGSILPCTGAHNEEQEMLLGRYPGSVRKEIILEGRKHIIDMPERSIKVAWHGAEIEGIRAIHKQNRRTEIQACRQCRHGAIKHGVEWIPEDWDMEKMQWKGRVWRE